MLKNLFNILTNGGSYNQWKIINKIQDIDDDIDEFIKSFQSELLALGDVISNNNHNFQNTLINKSNEDKAIKHINTSTTSMYLYTVERIILEHAITFLIQENDISVSVLDKDKYDYENNIYDFICEYDGIKIPNNINENDISIILKELNKYIYDVCGFDIEFCNKSITEFIGDKELQDIKRQKIATYEQVKD